MSAWRPGDSDDPARIARRFSPESNRFPGEDDGPASRSTDPIDVLVATDVLSEGQNLQDSHIVVNYDLPWAIIRIIQRAGRVDRVGQKSDTVYIYLITHEKVEQAIRLRQRIRQRLGDNAAAFGSDERFFGDDQEVNLLDDLYKGASPTRTSSTRTRARPMPSARLGSCGPGQGQRSLELAAKVLRMQDMVHSTRDPYDNETRTGVTCYASTTSGVDAFAASFDDPGGAPVERLLTPLEALHIFRAQDDRPPQRRFATTTSTGRSRLVREKLTSEIDHRRQPQRRPQVGGRASRRNTIFGADASEALSAMNERPLTEYANHAAAPGSTQQVHLTRTSPTW